jgi:hypothetical protein
MTILPRKKIVLLGMMSQMPVAGHVWLVVQYLVGFQRLGYDVYYVEAHGCTPRELMRSKEEDGPARAAAFIEQVMERFGFGERWAYHELHGRNRCFGLSESRLRELYASAALLINLHGGTVPQPEHSATNRLVYLGTDPVFVEVRLHEQAQETIDLLEPHCAFFTWGLNYGGPDCKVPVSDRFRFRPLPPPIVPDFWLAGEGGLRKTFTTVGNWRQRHEVRFEGEIYHWSKHYEFLKFLDLPRRTHQTFELALGRYEESDRELLEAHGWLVRRALDFSTDLDAYRQYLADSRGEFTVAKDQNVRLRSGWFSERSAQYLAAGRPVITQKTGFSNVLPTGDGLFAFSTLEEALAAVESVNGDYQRHCRAAADLARDYFSYDVVLRRMLAVVGL